VTRVEAIRHVLMLADAVAHEFAVTAAEVDEVRREAVEALRAFDVTEAEVREALS
jgi:hypothetical protein